MSKTLAIAVFLALLVAAIALGLGRDLFSRQQSQLTGEVVEVMRGDEDYKSHGVRTPRLKIRLADGRTVYVATAEPQRYTPGARVSLSEMAAPWGALWYKLPDE